MVASKRCKRRYRALVNRAWCRERDSDCGFSCRSFGLQIISGSKQNVLPPRAVKKKWRRVISIGRHTHAPRRRAPAEFLPLLYGFHFIETSSVSFSLVRSPQARTARRSRRSHILIGRAQLLLVKYTARPPPIGRVFKSCVSRTREPYLSQERLLLFYAESAGSKTSASLPSMGSDSVLLDTISPTSGVTSTAEVAPSATSVCALTTKSKSKVGLVGFGTCLLEFKTSKLWAAADQARKSSNTGVSADRSRFAASAAGLRARVSRQTTYLSGIVCSPRVICARAGRGLLLPPGDNVWDLRC